MSARSTSPSALTHTMRACRQGHSYTWTLDFGHWNTQDFGVRNFGARTSYPDMRNLKKLCVYCAWLLNRERESCRRKAELRKHGSWAGMSLGLSLGRLSWYTIHCQIDDGSGMDTSKQWAHKSDWSASSVWPAWTAGNSKKNQMNCHRFGCPGKSMSSASWPSVLATRMVQTFCSARLPR